MSSSASGADRGKEHTHTTDLENKGSPIEVWVKSTSMGTASFTGSKVLLDQSGKSKILCCYQWVFREEEAQSKYSLFHYSNLSSCIPGGLPVAKPSLGKWYCAILKHSFILLKTLLKGFMGCIQKSLKRLSLHLLHFQPSAVAYSMTSCARCNI